MSDIRHGKVEKCNYCGGRVMTYDDIGRVCYRCNLQPSYQFSQAVVSALRRAAPIRNGDRNSEAT